MAQDPEHLTVNISTFERPERPLLRSNGNSTSALTISTPHTGNSENCGLPIKGNRPSRAGDERRVDLSRYGLPDALTNFDQVLPERLANTITSSVENVLSQVAAESELRSRLQEEERRTLEENSEAAKDAIQGGDKGKGIERMAAVSTAVDGAQAPSERSDHQLVDTPPPTEATTPFSTTAKASPGTRSENDEHPLPDTVAAADDRPQESLPPVANISSEFSPKPKKRHFLSAVFRRLSDAGLYLGLFRSHFTRGSLNPDHRARPKKRKQGLHMDQEPSECISCFEDFAPKDLVKLQCHNYCKPCFQRLVENALETEAQWPPKCCLNRIDSRIVTENISPELFKKFLQKRREFSTPIHARYYCPVPDCGLFVPADRANTPFRRGWCKSGHLTCMDCRKKAHSDAVQCVKNRDMEGVQKLAAEEGWRRCYRCHTMIEHSNACRHMRCPCGAQFCMVCGAIWWTCGCTERQLEEIKRRARRNWERRRETEKRERREARELRKALEVIAGMEAEESEKLERTRAAKETRRKVMVTSNYADLMALLAEANEFQKGLIQGQHARDRRELFAQIRTAEEGLNVKNASRIEELRALSRRRIEEREVELWEQYKASHSEGACKGTFDERTGFSPDQEDNGKEHEGWPQYRDEHLQQSRSAVDEEQTMEEELLHAKTARLMETFKVQQREMQVKNRSELHWYNLVVAERTRLLEELLTAELENEIKDDDDSRWDTIVVQEVEDPGPSRLRQAGYKKSVRFLGYPDTP